jgi:DNA modification methylase
MGAGTTAVVAEAEGRQWIGIELNPDFVTQAEARLARARAKQSEQVHRKEVT